MQYWTYYADPERYRSAGVIEFEDGKVSRSQVNELVWMRCGSKRATLGDASGVVLANCWQPLHAQLMHGARGEEFEEWFYRRSIRARASLWVLTFPRDTLVFIERRKSGEH